VAGLVEFKGCPDRDNDKIIDLNDDCPDEAGLAVFKGCPDKDNDGVMDKNDECPEVPGPAEFKGCPDRDGDGIQDSKDDCPDEKGSLDMNGCPDRDGDGLPDKQDRCPDKPGPIKNLGCPEMKLQLLSSTLTPLEEVTMEMFPEVGRLKERIRRYGADGVLMSGSGPTVFGLVDRESRARRIVNALRGFCRQVFAVRMLGRSEGSSTARG